MNFAPTDHIIEVWPSSTDQERNLNKCQAKDELQQLRKYSQIALITRGAEKVEEIKKKKKWQVHFQLDCPVKYKWAMLQAAHVVKHGSVSETVEHHISQQLEMKFIFQNRLQMFSCNAWGINTILTCWYIFFSNKHKLFFERTTMFSWSPKCFSFESWQSSKKLAKKKNWRFANFEKVSKKLFLRLQWTDLNFSGTKCPRKIFIRRDCWVWGIEEWKNNRKHGGWISKKSDGGISLMPRAERWPWLNASLNSLGPLIRPACSGQWVRYMCECVLKKR